MQTDLSHEKIVRIVRAKMPIITKWAKALAKYEVKKIWSSFEIVKDDKKIILKRAIAIAKSLVKINGLSDEMIGELCKLEKTKIAQIRTTEKKKTT